MATDKKKPKTKMPQRWCEPKKVVLDPDFLKYCDGKIERKPEWNK